ncbi:hypothetical protein BWI17_17430 [Betaproteobacteria bacterium GR16-43]|nr:hypothetical protein BWI17_17430 [Betaproteobacteria bacterium GR16-43]
MKSKTLALSIAVALASPAAFAASGTFTFVTGEVTLTKKSGQRIPAVRGIEVDPGDLIATGNSGMAQLSMIDQARLSLRPNSQFRIEGYQTTATSTEGGVLNLLRGTLRTFTGLIATTNRDKFVMKTRVATVGIRGSGNILYACSVADGDCDADIAASAGGSGDITINHTIEGSHAITNDIPGNLPPQQGGPQTLITGPGQTVLVTGTQPPKYIPTPQFIADSATNPSNAKSAPGGANTDTRNFAPGDNQQLTGGNQNTTTPVGNNGLGFVTIDASSNLLSDPINLRDVVIASNGPFLGQATAGDLTLDGTALRGYIAYRGSLSDLRPVINGSSVVDVQTVSLGTDAIILGRYVNGTLGFSGPGSGNPVGGNVHWIYAPSGYPGYVSDVLTGTAVYTLAAATSPTNQAGTSGTLGTATLNVNFTNRTLSLGLAFSIPSASGNGGGAWTAQASNVPFALNSFYASTGDRLVVTNQFNVSSATNSLLIGSIEGSFVGSNLQGAILGYGITDLTDTTRANNNNSVTGVVAFVGPPQNGAAPFREGRISDPAGRLGAQDYSRNYATTNRPDEVTSDAQGRVTSFVGPASGLGNRATYTLGSAQVVQAGFDPDTGMVWGRWGGGVAQVSGNGQTSTVNLQSAGLHYIFAGSQTGPTALPLTGTASYDVIGNTNPTNSSGAVGTLGSATFDANFTNRTVASTVNVTIAGQNWIGSAPNMPIYRDMYFTASTGSSIPGAPNVSSLTLTCTPSCGQNAIGSFDGFFTGRTGQRAGMLYNMGGVQGAVAFGRRGG